MDTIALILPFLKCIYFDNPLSIWTKHLIIIQYFDQTSQNRNNLYLQQINILLISFDYLIIYRSYVLCILFLFGCMLQLYLRNIKIILYYISILALFEPIKAFNLLMLWIIVKDTRYVNIATYMFLNLLFTK